MNAPFRIVVKARGGEGAFHVAISALVAAIAGCFALVSASYGVSSPWFVYALLATVAVASLWFLGRAIADIRSDREWEFCADGNRIQWVSRNRSGECIECEIYLRDIRALIFQPDSGDTGAYLEVEFFDGSVKRLPLVGAPSGNSLWAFINYWRDTHTEIPIRNLENA